MATLLKLVAATAMAGITAAGCSARPSDENGVMLRGAGSTFAYPLYSEWAYAFGKAHPDVEIDYQSIGSGGGINLVTDGRIDFGATDGPMTDAQMETFAQQRGCRVLHLPMSLGADVPAYNVMGLSAELRFTPQALAGIFLGSITKWNDPALVSENPNVALPNAGIAVVHRADGSGTTYVWTDYLSKVSEEWRAKVGRGISVTWPVGTAASGNQGVADLIKATPNSIGYVELVYALRAKLPVGAVQNASGAFVKADLEHVTAAAAAAADSLPADFRVSLTNPPGADAYPISSFTWALLPTTFADSAKKKALIAFLNWALTDGQNYTEALSYARLPETVIAKTKAALAELQ